MENNTTTTETATLHIFERAGLGKAPFKFVGQVQQDIAYGQAVISRGEHGGGLITTQPGGTCDFCGAYILNMFRIKSADGRTFKVGSDCVMKTGDEGLKRRVAKIVNKNNAARAAARAAEKIAALKAQLADESVRAKLAATPGPNASFGGQTMLGYAEWMVARAGRAGQLRTAKIVAGIVEAAE